MMDKFKTVLTARGAYGRTYSNLEDILIDYLDGKDFRIINGSYFGPYFSIRDAEELLNDYFAIEVNGWLIPVK